MQHSAVEQVRSLHPEASDEAIEFHAHIVEYAMKANVPTEMLLDFGTVVPKAPIPVIGHHHGVDHSAELRIYGTYQGDCTRCVSSYPLWVPRKQDDLLVKPEAAEPILFDSGLLLTQMVKLERRYPNDRFRGVIAITESMIDRFDDLVTESVAYRNPPLEAEDGGRRGY